MIHKGFTLLEMMIVVSMMAALIVATLQFYKASSENGKITQAIQEQGQILGAIRNIYGVMPDYDGLNNTALFNSNSLPFSVLTPGKSTWIASPWSRNGITVSTTAAAPYDKIILKYTAGISPEICTSFISKMYREHPKVEVGTNTVHDITASTPATSDVTRISNECNAASSPIQITITSY